MQTANLHESAAAADRAGRAPINPGERDAADEGATDEHPDCIALPLIRPDFGGIVAARLIDNELSLSYSGPAPFGTELDQLLGAWALHLQAARRLRFVDSLRLVAAFADDGGDDQDGEADQ